MRTATGLMLTLLLTVAMAGRAEWYKGNTHSHTVNSDGDSSPDAVARWYMEHHYNFVGVEVTTA